MITRNTIINSEIDLKILAAKKPRKIQVRINNNLLLNSQTWSEFVGLKELGFLSDKTINIDECRKFLLKLPTSLKIIKFGFIDRSCLNTELYSRFIKLKELRLSSGVGDGDNRIRREVVEEFRNKLIEQRSLFKIFSLNFGFHQYLGNFWNEEYTGNNWEEYCDK